MPRKRAGTRIPISSSPSHALHESRLPLRIKPTRRSRHRTQGGLAHASQGSGAKALVCFVSKEEAAGWRELGSRLRRGDGDGALEGGASA